MTTDDCYLAKNEKIGNKLVVAKDTMSCHIVFDIPKFIKLLVILISIVRHDIK